MDQVPYGTFTLADHTFARFLPDSSTDDQVWTIVVTTDGQEIRRDTIPLLYRPTFGPDVSDMAACDERVEEIIKDLGLEG